MKVTCHFSNVLQRSASLFKFNACMLLLPGCCGGGGGGTHIRGALVELIWRNVVPSLQATGEFFSCL